MFCWTCLWTLLEKCPQVVCLHAGRWWFRLSPHPGPWASANLITQIECYLPTQLPIVTDGTSIASMRNQLVFGLVTATVLGQDKHLLSQPRLRHFCHCCKSSVCQLSQGGWDHYKLSRLKEQPTRSSGSTLLIKSQRWMLEQIAHG